MNTTLRFGRRLFAVSLLALGIGAAIAACSPNGAAPGKPGRLKVVCTIGMIADAARRIGGDRAEVSQLMGAGVDPHLYRATPVDMRLLRNADIALSNGLHLEGRMVEVLEKPGEGVLARAVSKAMDPARLMRPPEFEGQYDPHVWFDVSLWSKAVEAVRDAYIERDPTGKDSYEANASRYLAELTDLHAWCKTQLNMIPQDRRVLITAHDAFGYFGRAYDIEVKAIQGVSTDSEAGVKDINNLVDLIVARKIGAVFVESSVPRKTIEALVEGCRSRGHVVAIGGELFSDAMGADGTPEGTYIGMVRHNVNTIVKALAGAGSPG